jgi:regulator of nucleoside diphosphate kinase
MSVANAPVHGERLLTELDHLRLSKLLEAHPNSTLQALLDAAELVDSRAVPPHIVTMYSQVEIVGVRTGQRHTLTLCYPRDAEPSLGFVSVLSPAGSGLLGLPIGALAQWQTPSCEQAAAEIAAILFQPEASGDYLR